MKLLLFCKIVGIIVVCLVFVRIPDQSFFVWIRILDSIFRNNEFGSGSTYFVPLKGAQA
jgi:hypothetical protein